MMKNIFIPIVVIVLLLILIGSSIFVVPTGYIGVVTRWGAVNRAASPGINLRIPIVENVVLMNIRTQKDQVEATAMSENLQVVTSTIAVNYHLMEARQSKFTRTSERNMPISSSYLRCRIPLKW